MTSTTYIGNNNTALLVNCGVDLTTATILNLILRKPNGSRLTVGGVLEGTDTIKYIAPLGTFDVPGIWQVQVYVVMPGWSGYGAPTFIQVDRPI